MPVPSAKRYYEATGPTKAKLADMLQERSDCMKALAKWAKSHGGKLATADNWTLTAVLSLPDGKEPADQKNWKRYRPDSPHWIPRLSTKIGKQLHEELRALASAVPSSVDFGSAIKLPFMGSADEGPCTYTPGVSQRGNRIFVVHTHPTWNPPKGVTLKRISDLQYEKLTAA